MAQARPKSPYKAVPIPSGYRRALPKEITPKVQRAAVRALQQCLPLGKLQATEIDGKVYAFLTEGHYDDHVTKPGKPIWHPGISTIVPKVQPKRVVLASQAVRDAQFINQARMSGEDLSSFEGEGMWSRFKKWLAGPPLPTAKPTPVQSTAQKKAADAAATAMVLSSMRGDDDFGEDDFGEDDFGEDDIGADPYEENLESKYAEDELYDPVFGEDFESDVGEDIGAEFGDEFGAARRRAKAKVRAKAKARGKVKVKAKGRIQLRGGLKVKGKAKVTKRRPSPRPKARTAPRPKARPAPRPKARPVSRPSTTRPVRPARPARPATPPRTTPTKTDSPLGPSAPFDDTVMSPPQEVQQAEAYEAPQEALQEESFDEAPEVEDAFDAYQEQGGGEETPETADEGSDTYDASAINGENFTHDKFSVGA